MEYCSSPSLSELTASWRVDTAQALLQTMNASPSTYFTYRKRIASSRNPAFGTAIRTNHGVGTGAGGCAQLTLASFRFFASNRLVGRIFTEKTIRRQSGNGDSELCILQRNWRRSAAVGNGSS